MRKILLSCFFVAHAFFSWAQERTVTGKVTSSEDGSALPGVNVVLKGTTTGTVTDVTGTYTLSVPGSGGVLVFTFIGLESQEIEIGERSVVDVQLAADVQQLTEVVVTALGIEKERKALGYAIQEVGGDQLTVAREGNLVNSLAGRVAGAQITNSSGSVGASSRIVLRGASSLTNNNQPLFVVDGIPISNSSYSSNFASGANGPTSLNYQGGQGGIDRANGAADINPDDIESISVLPGPNAAALYGSRASNGVIIIKTKSGRGTQGIGISVNSSATFERPLRLPSYQNSYGGGYNENAYTWIDGTSGSGGEDESWGPPLDKGLEFIQWNSFDGQPLPWVSRPDNIKNFFETGKTLQNTVSLTGGSDKGNFRLSLGNYDQTGMIPNTDSKRTNISLNTGLNLTSKLRAEATANYIKSGSDNTPGNGYDNNNVMQQFTWFQRNVDVEALKDFGNLPLAPEGTSAEGTPANWNTNFNNNPYWVLHNNTNSYDKDRIIGNVRIAYDLTDWLSLAVRTGTDYSTDLEVFQRAIGSNDFPNGAYRETTRTFYEINSDFLLSVKKNFSEDLKFNANVGGNKMRQVFSRNILEAPELEIPDVYNLQNSKVAVKAFTRDTEEVINSLYASVDFNFRDYLFLGVTARNDWSSTLPANNNSYFYPSVSLSSDITSMLGLESNVLSYAKVRTSWAEVGSDTDPYRLQNVYNFFDKWDGSLISPTVDRILNNPDLKPETSTSFEIGTELGFLGNRIMLNATYYTKNSIDQIVDVTVTAASGYTSRFMNAGEISNKGIEITLSGAPVRSASGFTWDITANYTRNRNEVVSLPPGLELFQLHQYWNAQVVARPGQPYGVIYGVDYERSPDGRIVHKDGTPQSAGNKDLGNVAPDWVGGLNNTFSFKGLSLGVLVDAKIGGSVYSMTNAWGRYAGILEETLIGREEGIVGDGVMQVGTDEAGNPVYAENNVVVDAQRYNHAAFGNNIVAGSVFDASYVKLRQISIGYSFPRSLISKTPFKGITFSVIGRNLALLYSKVPHIDPETAFGSGNEVLGLEHASSPSSRSIGFNLNFSL